VKTRVYELLVRELLPARENIATPLEYDEVVIDMFESEVWKRCAREAGAAAVECHEARRD